MKYIRKENEERKIEQKSEGRELEEKPKEIKRECQNASAYFHTFMLIKSILFIHVHS